MCVRACVRAFACVVCVDACVCLCVRVGVRVKVVPVWRCRATVGDKAFGFTVYGFDQVVPTAHHSARIRTASAPTDNQNTRTLSKSEHVKCSSEVRAARSDHVRALSPRALLGVQTNLEPSECAAWCHGLSCNKRMCSVCAVRRARLSSQPPLLLGLAASTTALCRNVTLWSTRLSAASAAAPSCEPQTT